jgi:fumarate hydratase class II
MDTEFPLPVWQTGSGTDQHDAAEVIANRHELVGATAVRASR